MRLTIRVIGKQTKVCGTPDIFQQPMHEFGVEYDGPVFIDGLSEQLHSSGCVVSVEVNMADVMTVHVEESADFDTIRMGMPTMIRHTQQQLGHHANPADDAQGASDGRPLTREEL